MDKINLMTLNMISFRHIFSISLLAILAARPAMAISVIASEQYVKDMKYTLPVAGDELGGVKSGGDIAVNPTTGAVTVNSAARATGDTDTIKNTYATKAELAAKADNDTKYSAGTNVTITGTNNAINVADASSTVKGVVMIGDNIAIDTDGVITAKPATARSPGTVLSNETFFVDEYTGRIKYIKADAAISAEYADKAAGDEKTFQETYATKDEMAAKVDENQGTDKNNQVMVVQGGKVTPALITNDNIADGAAISGAKLNVVPEESDNTNAVLDPGTVLFQGSDGSLVRGKIYNANLDSEAVTVSKLRNQDMDWTNDEGNVIKRAANDTFIGGKIESADIADETITFDKLYKSGESVTATNVVKIAEDGTFVAGRLESLDFDDTVAVTRANVGEGVGSTDVPVYVDASGVVQPADGLKTKISLLELYDTDNDSWKSKFSVHRPESQAVGSVNQPVYVDASGVVQLVEKVSMAQTADEATSALYADEADKATGDTDTIKNTYATKAELNTIAGGAVKRAAGVTGAVGALDTPVYVDANGVVQPVEKVSMALTAEEATSALYADEADKATKDSNGAIIVDTYLRKDDVQTAVFDYMTTSSSGTGAVVTGASLDGSTLSVTKGNVKIPAGSETATATATIWVQ